MAEWKCYRVARTISRYIYSLTKQNNDMLFGISSYTLECQKRRTTECICRSQPNVKLWKCITLG